ncbi:hypothetical protein [Janibacter sp. G56]|uniref:hypothetical protein n=1 Tax=Janibacter sp. G56 TaxID=3418717 RepID=UPI003D009F81
MGGPARSRGGGHHPAADHAVPRGGRQLADNIIVIDHGRIIAEGTPLQLKDQSGRASLVVTVSRPEDMAETEQILRREIGGLHVDAAARRFTAPAEGLSAITRIAALIEEQDIQLDDIGLQRPSLDDVFLNLTGHRAEVAEPSTEDTEVPA